MKKNILNILFWVAALTAVSVIAAQGNSWLKPKTAFAVGDLTIDWGVPAGAPIFTVTEFAPGETESRTVLITNNAATARPVGVRGVKTAGNGLSDQLNITISTGAADLYGGSSGGGPKSLTTFFTDSTGPSGITLFTLAPGDSENVTFRVQFNESAGNTLQGDSVTLDIKIGIAFDVPVSCDAIDFSGEPIFGTEGSDTIRTRNGNDLIVAFEGADVIRSGNGDDCIIGGAGNDTIRGENGSDQIFGGAGNDTLRGDNGNDIIEGEDGNDVLRGDNGSDSLRGGAGRDVANGDNGADTCEAETKANCEL